MYEITNQTPKNWDDYIKLLISAYKALYPDKTQYNLWFRWQCREKWRRKKGPRYNGNR